MQTLQAKLVRALGGVMPQAAGLVTSPEAPKVKTAKAKAKPSNGKRVFTCKKCGTEKAGPASICTTCNKPKEAQTDFLDQPSESFETEIDNENSPI